jgi:isocitrate dehydrogenase
LEDCIAELRSKGYDVPLYPREPQTEEEMEIRKKYQSVMGSAVNPVLREGNSDRRVAPPVKAYAQKNPHRMGIWSKASRTHVAHMSKGDFYASEKSAVMGDEPTNVRIEFTPKDGGAKKVFRESIPLEAKEVIDASFLSIKDCGEFLEQEIEDSKETETLFSLHLKATMMKVSDPIMFGQCIRVFYKDAFAKHGRILQEIGANPNQGLASIFEVVSNKLDAAKAKEIFADFESCYEDRPWLAMVDSDRGITNLHAPNDIIIDASMPVVIRDSGKMWNKLGVSFSLYFVCD